MEDTPSIGAVSGLWERDQFRSCSVGGMFISKNLGRPRFGSYNGKVMPPRRCLVL